jgi:hypothetical protein
MKLLAVGELSDNSPCYTFKGLSFLISWKDGTSIHVPLREMKDFFPLQTCEYAATHSLTQEPAFLLSVPHFLKKHDRIIGKLSKKNNKSWHRTHKYGIELPKTVDEWGQLFRMMQLRRRCRIMHLPSNLMMMILFQLDKNTSISI